MQKFFTLTLIVAAFCIGTTAFAQGPHHGHRPGPPPRHHGYHGGWRHQAYEDWYDYNNRGTGLAWNIVGMVGAGLNIIRPIVNDVITYTNEPATTTTTTTYTTGENGTVIHRQQVEQPAYQRQVIQQNVPVYTPPAPPVYTPVYAPVYAPGPLYRPVQRVYVGPAVW